MSEGCVAGAVVVAVVEAELAPQIALVLVLLRAAVLAIVAVLAWSSGVGAIKIVTGFAVPSAIHIRRLLVKNFINFSGF